MKIYSKIKFSLIELLVVISILAILLTILSPSLKRVLGTAEMAHCATNLQKAGIMTTIYGGDNDDDIPPTWWNASKYKRYGTVTSVSGGGPLGDYGLRELSASFGNKGAINCPSWPYPEYSSFGQNMNVAAATNHGTSLYWKYIQVPSPASVVYWGPSWTKNLDYTDHKDRQSYTGAWPHFSTYAPIIWGDKFTPKLGRGNFLFLDGSVNNYPWDHPLRGGNFTPGAP